MKVSISEKERILLEKIDKAKVQLERLQKKQRTELGKIACKHGLHAFPKAIIDESFKRLARELSNEPQ